MYVYMNFLYLQIIVFTPLFFFVIVSHIVVCLIDIEIRNNLLIQISHFVNINIIKNVSGIIIAWQR